MTLRIIGEHPFACDGSGKLRSHIATIFPDAPALVTVPPEIASVPDATLMVPLLARFAAPSVAVPVAAVMVTVPSLLSAPPS